MLDDWDWTIGVVAAPFGVRGEMKVRIETDFPERFRSLDKICLRPPAGSPKLVAVRAARLHKGQALLKLEGIDDPEAVSAWRGARVQIRRAAAMALPKDSYYTADLVGLEVVTVDGRSLGRLTDVRPNPGHDLLVVDDIVIPAVKEIVREIDLAGRRVVVDPPEGLLETG